MKKILITLLATSALGLGSYAYAHNNNATRPNGDMASWEGHPQEHGTHKHNPKHAKKHFKRMSQALDLSYDQVEAIKALHEQAKADRPERERDVRIHHLNPNAEDYYETVAAIAAKRAADVENAILKRAELHASMFAILTPEQQQKALTLAAERKTRKARYK